MSQDHDDEPVTYIDQPLTLRQWYAGQALAGMLARDYYPPEGAAFGAFKFADAMIEQEK